MALQFACGNAGALGAVVRIEAGTMEQRVAAIALGGGAKLETYEDA